MLRDAEGSDGCALRVTINKQIRGVAVVAPPFTVTVQSSRGASLRRENSPTKLTAMQDCIGMRSSLWRLCESEVDQLPSEVDQLSGVSHTAGVGVELRRQPVGLIGAVLAGIAACGDPVQTDFFDVRGLGGAAAASGRGHLGGNGGRAGSGDELGGAPSEEA
ncbi:MAG TPA: hypothetical protein VJV79_21395, partial [Polyangiaceae bacterium]|nr:hypothetical protein [Polyangiaceae bacterium]